MRLSTQQHSIPEISDRPTMPQGKPKVGIVSLNSSCRMGERITDYSKEIVLIGNYSSKYRHNQWMGFLQCDRRRLQNNLLSRSLF